jgi:hypothetical protein
MSKGQTVTEVYLFIFTNSRYEVYEDIPFNVITGNILNSESTVTWDVKPCTPVEVC